MHSKDGLVRIKWAGPNTPFFELERNSQRFYPTKRELLAIRQAIKLFVKAYPEDFTEERIDFVDEVDGNWEDSMPVDIKKLQQQQEDNRKRWRALDKLARDSGFDDDALANTEFSLMPFFEAIVEECAKRAELQSRVYSDGNAGAGCFAAANAIRTFGKNLGLENG